MNRTLKTLTFSALAVSAGAVAVAAMIAFAGANPVAAASPESPAQGFEAHRGWMTGTKPMSGTMKMPRLVMTETVVMSVAPGSPAEAAGIQAGDIIVKVDGQAAGFMDLNKAVATKKPGDKISLEVRDSDGANRTLEVTLGEAPNRAGVAYLGVMSMPGRGIGVGRGMPGMGRNMPRLPNLGGRGGALQLPEGVDKAVAVVSVQADSPAAKAGLAGRDLIVAVDGKAPESTQALIDAIGAKKAGDSVTVKVYRPSTKSTLELSVTLGENPQQAGKAFMGVSLSSRMIERQQTPATTRTRA